MLVHLEENIAYCPIGTGDFPQFTYEEMWAKYFVHLEQSATSSDEQRIAAGVSSNVNEWLSLDYVRSPVVQRFLKYFKEKVCTSN